MDMVLSKIDEKPEEAGEENLVGDPVGNFVAGNESIVCTFVGERVCIPVGSSVGRLVGRDVGLSVSFFGGNWVGRPEGSFAGCCLGLVVASDGIDEGDIAGQNLGIGPLIWLYQL